MRKLILSALMLATGAGAFAQKLSDVEDKLSKGKYDEARATIDKMMADPKNQTNANAWYRKGSIYGQLAMDSTKADQALANRAEALNAFKKYYELDPKNVLGQLEQNVRMFQLYEGHYNAALGEYNKQNFAGSFANFSKALETEEYIKSKGFTYGGINFPALDTNLYLNTAATALKAKMEDSAMKYYAKLADAKIKNDQFIEVYQTLVDYYGRKGDKANQMKYMEIGKELYPGNDYWVEAELEPVRDNKPQLFAKYQELIGKNPGSYYLNYNYAVELFNYMYANDQKPADAATIEPLVEPAIAAAIKANSNADANYLMVRYMTEKIYRTEDAMRALKGTDAASINKRKNYAADIKKQWAAMAPYAETAFAAYEGKKDLKGFEKGNFKNVSNVLTDYYGMQKNEAKVKEYQDRLKAAGM
ncbi:hypothetical protein SAMN05444008_102147 [Cnuella takakiae]|uniref:Tetratricopeptide repeat-containing protein n=1 Tax=Cnuella takakiae TaxID=1302690 RepID=A0A1M4V606_9BACT|nr:hypothetical protein [Cnuella takakiae]SHE64350.1 hypothetical protein SAMN05444008_102147 [Cnuella takakiae]